MPEYINKQELLEKAKSLQGKLWGDVLIVNAIENAEGVDIVFCKECEYWQKYNNTAGAGDCLRKEYSFTYGNERTFNPITMPTHFCSYGERKEK